MKTGESITKEDFDKFMSMATRKISETERKKLVLYVPGDELNKIADQSFLIPPKKKKLRRKQKNRHGSRQGAAALLLVQQFYLRQV